jgi:2-C-methyl-D-erythritol 4-phosphate cytidylyltransferase
MSRWAIVVAGGSGTRYGARKQFEALGGRTVLDWALDGARQACDGVVLVLPADEVDAHRSSADHVVAGGATRSASVRCGLSVVPDDATVVAVHDAARPLADAAVWSAVIGAVQAGADAAIPAVPVADTIKRVDDTGRLETLDRSRLVAVQTPQAFRAGALRAAHVGGGEATDDAALVEATGGKVVTVPGRPGNLKVTTPQDLLIASVLLEASLGGQR